MRSVRRIHSHRLKVFALSLGLACNGGSSSTDGDATAGTTTMASSSTDPTSASIGSDGADSTGGDETETDTGGPAGVCESPVDWTPGDTVGVPGGIRSDRAPCATAACTALENADAGYRDGTLDALALIQAAIDSAEPETYVAIPAGTWMIGGSVNIGHERDNITVRGAGMDGTIIDCHSNDRSNSTTPPGSSAYGWSGDSCRPPCISAYFLPSGESCVSTNGIKPSMGWTSCSGWRYGASETGSHDSASAAPESFSGSHASAGTAAASA